jgi:replication factor C subunit 2/4
MPTEELADLEKAKICEKMAQADKALVDGADEYLQLIDIGSSIMNGLCA